MPTEPVEVRLARMEEGIVGLHGRLVSQHKEVMASIAPLQKRINQHHDWIVVIRRDRWWLFVLVGAVFPFAMAAAAYAARILRG